MAANTTLNAKNLETLGAARLAELLIEVSKGSAAAKRRLRIELAGSLSSGEVARQVGKRLMSIERSRSRITWRRIKALKADLEIQRRVIVETIAIEDPDEAMEVMWRFIALARPVLARCNDSNGTIAAVFDRACMDLGEIAKTSKQSPVMLADRAFAALQDNDHGHYDRLVEILTPALGPEGLDHLKSLLLQISKLPVEQPLVDDERPAPSAHGHDEQFQRKQKAIGGALEQIADAQGDVDAFIQQQGGYLLTSGPVAAEVAQRLLQAGRAQDALDALDAAKARLAEPPPHAWTATRADALEALGRSDDAQTLRLRSFKRSLDDRLLRAYLKRLPDFDDIEAEEEAMEFATAFPDAKRALAFLIAWPALGKAGELVAARSLEIDGEDHELLGFAAEGLSEKYPLAAILLYRKVVDFTLEHARTAHYRTAARYLEESGGLANRSQIPPEFPAHEIYVGALRRKHERRRGFWKWVT